ncbi:nucleoside-diphosphate sugar epimerase/dehydratase [Longimicrobium sp.]|uniref:polysaccharide biosynthesis protein n=1 Tax=Longimicrobium sp. TaxID=2029185 RepID=UPI002E2EF9BC|nr:nucleoside-diphosphate sugar epimerase/dehydratase [Longimicrobium sp.]HEX6041551.1 nucleoside-diphosphate sugar epimerase/dehydratase [Longimicrobium sp.]
MLPALLIRLRRPIVLALHLLLIPLAYYGAFALRFDFRPPQVYVDLFWRTLPYLVVLRLACFALFGLFHGWWRHVGMRDLVDLVRANTLSSVLLVLALFMTGDLQGPGSVSGLPRSVLVLDWVTALILFGGVRFAVRAFREERLVPWRAPRGRRTLIIGAGTGAERLLRETQREGESELSPVAMVDDDPAKVGMRLHGIPVLGTVADLDDLARKAGIQQLVIAIPSATRKEMRRIVEACLRTELDFKIVPSIRELLDGRARLGQLRNVEIEDLLGREAIELDLDGPQGDLEGRTVLVTGGAGSIGNELARQVATFNPKRLIVLDQAESPLYFANLELRTLHPALDVIPIVADVTDHARIESIFARHRPDFVFHAAAYKHVPLMEDNPVEAVRNNVLGTLCVAQAAARYGADKFVLISTDKAVYPSSVMGATKRLAEQIVLGWPALRESQTDFRAVRFGNVLGSDGSVIPLFKKQLAAGQPITVTDREVTRYFMTIPEAVQLVLQASALANATGRICMLEMGEPVRIVELAENLIRLSGLEPYTDVPIVFTGLRPGEKLHEELMSEREMTIPTSISKVRIVQTAEPEPHALMSGLDRLAAAAAVGSRTDILDAIRDLVPECVPPLRERTVLAENGD